MTYYKRQYLKNIAKYLRIFECRSHYLWIKDVIFSLIFEIVTIRLILACIGSQKQLKFEQSIISCNPFIRWINYASLNILYRKVLFMLFLLCFQSMKFLWQYIIKSKIVENIWVPFQIMTERCNILVDFWNNCYHKVANQIDSRHK